MESFRKVYDTHEEARTAEMYYTGYLSRMSSITVRRHGRSVFIDMPAIDL